MEKIFILADNDAPLLVNIPADFRVGRFGFRSSLAIFKLSTAPYIPIPEGRGSTARHGSLSATMNEDIRIFCMREGICLGSLNGQPVVAMRKGAPMQGRRS
jgi:hypothetical protein